VAKASVVPGSQRPNNIFFARLKEPQVAIKRISVETAYKDCYHAKQVYREIALLKQLAHDNMIKLVDLFSSPLGDVYIVTEAMDCDLGRMLNSSPEVRWVFEFFCSTVHGCSTLGAVHAVPVPSYPLLLLFHPPPGVCAAACTHQMDHVPAAAGVALLALGRGVAP
jgi:hypothetical protein